MYRAIPVGNKILASKWQKENHARLQGNIQNIKASIDVKGPSKVDHLKKKSKKTQMQEGKYLMTRERYHLPISNFFVHLDRYTEIERENRILLEKMTSIL